MIFYLILALIPLAVLSDEPCARPAKLLEFEDACKTDPEVTGNTGSFLEQLQENIAAAMEQTKRLINIAKKKLGVKVDEQASNEQNKKCEYYQCIFRKMDSLGSTNYPNMTLMETWINDNVDDSLKDSTLVKVYSCFNAMATNIATDEIAVSFLTGGDDKMIKPSDDKTDHDMDTAPEDNMRISSACDISAKLMMCLHNDMMCSAFQYP